MKTQKLEDYGIKELRNGLTFKKIKNSYFWLLEAQIEDAIIGRDEAGLVWYNGTWKSGTWQGGIWENGTWKIGVWQNGIWENGVWENGWWKHGWWQDGVWQNGTWESGVWKKGEWKGGDFAIKSSYHILITGSNLIKIGCEEKTIKEWDEWFASDEVFEAPRNTKVFKLIYAHYRAIKEYLKVLSQEDILKEYLGK